MWFGILNLKNKCVIFAGKSLSLRPHLRALLGFGRRIGDVRKGLLMAKKIIAEAKSLSLREILLRASPTGRRPKDIQGFISTGCDILDYTFGGGLAYGRIYEAFGFAHSGRTGTALQAGANCLRAGGAVVYIDSDKGLDLNWARKLGCDPDRMEMIQPLWLEEVHTMIRDVVVNREEVPQPTLIVWDVVGPTKPRSVSDPKPGEKGDGLNSAARMNNTFFSEEWVGRLRCSNIVLYLANTVYSTFERFGDKEATPGGNRISYVADLRFKTHKGHEIEDDGNVIGHQRIYTVDKNKITGRLLTATTCTLVDKGIDNLLTNVTYLFDSCKDSSGRLEYNGKKWFQKTLYRHLQGSPAEQETFRQFVRQVWSNGGCLPDTGGAEMSVFPG
jgi:RecA/RadA recombinase